jgi:hypothetical protein
MLMLGQDRAGKSDDIYTPLYYLVDNSTYYNGGGSGSSDVAPYWRIRTGIEQGDAALNTELNLALALQNYSGVKSVDFETIWGQGHTQAEDTGDADANFISWVEECVLMAQPAYSKNRKQFHHLFNYRKTILTRLTRQQLLLL